MATPSGGTNEPLPLTQEVVTILESDVISAQLDSGFVYAACADSKVRLWSRKDWSLAATLGDTDSSPLAIHVDDEHIYATCEKQVYVWKKETFGMIGWFELSYQALTAMLSENLLYVGAREGRLVSIDKESHETSSWQLNKSDIISLWVDQELIVTCSKKGNPHVWKRRDDQAPSLMSTLDAKEKARIVHGNSLVIITGFNNGEIKTWNRVDCTPAMTLETRSNDPIVSMWANNYYLIAGNDQGALSVWDLKSGTEIGFFKLKNERIHWIGARENHIYAATNEGIEVLRLNIGEIAFDFSSDIGFGYSGGLLRTSPYDVLEKALVVKTRGDESLATGVYQEAVADYEHALQLLIDNSHALLEVPEEREKLTKEINTKLGRALLRSKIAELQEIDERIEQISDELDARGRTEMQEDDLDKLWNEASRAIKESRVLAEAQAGDMLAYQLAYVAEDLSADLEGAKQKEEKYREKINQAHALIQGMKSEWRWMERKRTSLEQRRAFLETTIERLETHLDEVEDDDEVRTILEDAIKDHKAIYAQIFRILDASENGIDEEFSSRDQDLSAINGLLAVVPKKREAILSIKDIEERKREMDRLIQALTQALHTANHHKLKDEIRDLENLMAALRSTSGFKEGSINQDRTENDG